MPDYIWPLSKSSIPNEMNTSFGPRINTNRWDFHDGIDLPAEKGTTIYAVRDGIVHLTGNKETNGYSSRHIVLEVDDPNDGKMYLVHLHLDCIDPAVIPGAGVKQGQELGRVGDDGAEYPHLHLEFLQDTPDPTQETSRHPLKYLPYSDTANFTAAVVDRFNRLNDDLMAARLLFGTCNKSEGDLLKVEVDLLGGTEELLATRIVDFHDEETINKKRGNSDTKIFTNDIGVEGYQKSPMNDPKRARTDLKYGILVRNIPDECDTLIARVFDVGGNSVTSAPIPVPNQEATDEFFDFEDDAMPPIGWTVVKSPVGTTVANDLSAAHSGSRGMRCADDPAVATETQRACIEYTLPTGRFEWIAEGRFNPAALGLAEDQSIHLLGFVNGENLCVAARIRNKRGLLLAGIEANDLDGDIKEVNSSAIIVPGVWRRWRLHLLRIGTRETTAVLRLDADGKMVEQDRLDWDSTASEPLALRAGIACLEAGATATVLVDELRLTESS